MTFFLESYNSGLLFLFFTVTINVLEDRIPDRYKMDPFLHVEQFSLDRSCFVLKHLFARLNSTCFHKVITGSQKCLVYLVQSFYFLFY